MRDVGRDEMLDGPRAEDGEMSESTPRSFTIDEVIDLGLEAYHREGDGVWWFYRDGLCLRTDSAAGRCTLVVGRWLLPQGPWRPTRCGREGLQQARRVQLPSS
jgi:hypothetical protein